MCLKLNFGCHLHIEAVTELHLRLLHSDPTLKLTTPFISLVMVDITGKEAPERYNAGNQVIHLPFKKTKIKKTVQLFNRCSHLRGVERLGSGGNCRGTLNRLTRANPLRFNECGTQPPGFLQQVWGPVCSS